MVASSVPPTRGLACNPGFCPDWEWNLGPLALQSGTQSTETHHPGQILFMYDTWWVLPRLFCIENSLQELAFPRRWEEGAFPGDRLSWSFLPLRADIVAE